MKKLFLQYPQIKNPRELRLWLIVHLSIPALLGLSLFFATPVRINTLLMDMLPQGERSGAAAEADKILGERTGREAVILAAAPDFETAKKGAAIFYSGFEHSPMAKEISLYFDASFITKFTEQLHNYRFVLADRNTRHLLETNRAKEIAQDALAAAYGAFGFFALDNIETDPFLLAKRQMETYLSPAFFGGKNLGLKDDVLAAHINETWYVLIRITLAAGAVSLSENKNAARDIYALASAVKEKMPGLEFYFSGIPFHSYESSSSAQREISIIGIVTFIIILAIFLYVFRSPLPVLLSVLTALVSLGMATGAAFLIFREIHILTFVFGTALIGICVDYSIHFFVQWKGNRALKNGYEIRAHISKSIIMSFVSTEICFLTFLFAPFPILKQFAVFSMTGLLSSFLTSYCIYPLLLMPSEEKKQFGFLKINNLALTDEVCLFREVEIVSGFNTKISKVLFNLKHPTGQGIKPTDGINFLGGNSANNAKSINSADSSNSAKKISRLFSMPLFHRIIFLAGIGVIALFILGSQGFSHGFLPGLRIENDIRSFYTMSDAMRESEKHAAQVLEQGGSPCYFIVSGETAEETLQHEEALLTRLEEAGSNNRGAGAASFLGTSVFIPSVKSQKETYEAMKALLPLAAYQYKALGFPGEYTEIFYKEFISGEKFLSPQFPQDPQDTPLPAGISSLWIGKAGSHYYSCVLPVRPAPADEELLRSIAKEFEFVHFVNKAKEISSDLNTLSKTIMLLFLAAYFVISVIVFLAYAWKESVKICAIPVFIFLSVMAALSVKKIPLGFFSIAALVLVFGLGLDYIFYMTGRKNKGNKNLSAFAVVLSFITTLLSFGALGFSGFMPVHTFGFTVSVGISAALLCALFLQSSSQSSRD